ncbi:MAG TPA: LysR family transcriptional regulator [Burkholderiaceae bacterium]|nr:LysR family transcriptional regulator [Burkholderiaceae bacterium]
MTTLSLRALRAVEAVTEAGGASQAALALHQSPSAVTRAVQGAEQALGVALFERGARGMVATAACQTLALRVGRAMQALQVAAQGLRQRGAPASVASLPRLASDALLHALVARAAHATEAAAAQSLGLSQPALHQALRRLEHAAKTQLFERTRSGTRLNESGEWLLQQAKIALAEIRIGHEELARWRGQGSSQLAIGSLPMASDVLVPQAVALVLAQEPALRITVKDGTYESLTQLLRSADIDFMVGPLRGADAASDLEEETLYVDRFVAVVRRGHPLLHSGRRASLRRLAPFPWIGPLPGTPAHAVFERLFAQAGLEAPTVALRAHSPAVVRSVLLAGDHVALLSPLQVQAEVRSGLLACASGPLPGSERAIGITQRRDALASLACRTALTALRRVTADALAGLRS